MHDDQELLKSSQRLHSGKQSEKLTNNGNIMIDLEPKSLGRIQIDYQSNDDKTTNIP